MLKKIKLRSLLANSWVLLFLAVLVAGGLTFLLYKYLNDREQKLKDDIVANHGRSDVDVVVPARDVPVGTPLSSSDFVSRPIQSDLVYEDMIRPEDFEKYRTSHLVKPVHRGRPLRTSDVDALSGRDFSDVLAAGKRAVTVEIDTVNSTALMIRPGNHVDMYWIGKSSSDDQASNDKRVARLIMPDVLVLATGQDIRPRDAGEAAQQDPANANSSAMSRQEGMGYTTVTLEVPVDDVGRIALAQKIGGLRLILRNSGDKGKDGPSLIQESDVFLEPSRRATTLGNGPAPQVVEMIAGGGTRGVSVITPQGAQSGSQQEAPAAAAQLPPTAPAAPERQPSLYEQANAIAQQLQKTVAPSASKRN